MDNNKEDIWPFSGTVAVYGFFLSVFLVLYQVGILEVKNPNAIGSSNETINVATDTLYNSSVAIESEFLKIK